MKKFFLPLTCLITLISCTLLLNSCGNLQGHESKRATVATNVPATPPDAKAPAAIKAPAALRKGWMTAADLNTLASRINMPAIICCDTDKENPTENGGAYNGFFGTDHYRIEMHVANVERDKTNGLVWHISGKTRYKKVIESFKGDIIIDSAFNESSDNLGLKGDQPPAYCIISDSAVRNVQLRGRFTFNQPTTGASAGKFSGTLYMDIIAMEKEYELSDGINDETRGACWLMDGNWASYDGKQQKPLLCARDLFAFGNDILKNFTYGDREIEVNPKYRKLGWDNYWSNEEWWNDSSTPPVSISGH